MPNLDDEDYDDNSDRLASETSFAVSTRQVGGCNCLFDLPDFGYDYL